MNENKGRVHEKDLIGRRVFGDYDKIFSDKEKNHYKINIFLDNRDGGLSFDILGSEGRTFKRNMKKLTALGHDMGQTKMGKDFCGWANLQADAYHKLMQKTPAIGEDNPYHAEIMCQDHFPTPEARRFLAFKLSEEARKFEFIKPGHL